jgi:hypothetical protein
MYEWAFNRLVMYCNRFVASESCTPLRDPLRKAHDIRNEISVYPFIWGICHRCALLPPPSLSLYLSLSLPRPLARSLARSLAPRRLNPRIGRVSRRGRGNFHRRLWKWTRGNLDIRAIARSTPVGRHGKSRSIGDGDRHGERSVRATTGDGCPLILSLSMARTWPAYGGRHKSRN